MKRLNVKEIEECYKEILKDISLMGKHIAIDGKELRSAIPEGKKHSLVQMVNVWSSEYGLSFGQMKIEEKSNEIKAIPELLKMFACRGSVVSIDAIGCQKEIIEQIEVLGGKYVIGLKSNQKELYSQVESEMTRQFKQLEKTMYIERDKTGSRGEERRVMVLENLTFIDAKEAWKGLKSVVMVERIRINKGKEERSKSYYISSIEGENANYYANIIRKHWSIENQLHRQATLWHLDMTFKEDDSPLKGQNALIHLHIIRKWALYLLKKEGSSISINRKRKKAARNHSFLKKILFE
jgi:predicted transposase YbfD/YdcC